MSHYMVELMQETGEKCKEALGVLPREHFNHETIGGNIKNEKV